MILPMLLADLLPDPSWQDGRHPAFVYAGAVPPF
jgi:hypothetical protein